MRLALLLTTANTALLVGVAAAAAPSTAPSFAAAKGYETGAGPESAAIADVDGDGKQDLVTGNYYGATVSVLLNGGNGVFQRHHDYDVGTGPVSIAVSDLNGDGKADVVSANLWTETISVLLNRVDGTFGAAVSYAAGRPYDMAVADVNGDAAPDLVFTNGEADSLSVLTNRGDGTFGSERDYETGAGPNDVEVGDLNGDGRPDIATANGSASTVSVLLNTGGGFAHSGEYDGEGGFPRLALGDLNVDGKPDIVVVGDGGAVSLLNRGDGSFAAARLRSAWGHVLADLNGDGSPDFVTSGVWVSMNLGSGHFGPEVGYGGGRLLAVGDLNGDGRPDLVSSGEDYIDGGSVSVRLNTPGLCNVQSVNGEYFRTPTLAAAKRILARGLCRVGKVSRVFSPYVKKGLVISQKPGFGAVLPQGGKVRLVISKGKRR